MSLPFLLEIGAEEIPDWMIVPALNNLQDMFQTMLDQQALGGMVKHMDATPRRLVLRAEGLADRQKDSEELVMGPPVSAGPGAKAAFAKKMGAAPEELGTQSTAKGEYLSYRKLVKGRPARDLLAEALPALILKIHFPKTMYWNGKGAERFIRPIRWIVALLGDSIVPFQIGTVKAANHTEGHRLLGDVSVVVSIADFEDRLQHNGVILSAARRRDRIERGIAELLAGRDLRVRFDPALLDTLIYLTELPTPIAGSFDRQFLDLPQEILVTVMRHHQRYFPVEHPDGSLAPHFIAVMNTDSDSEGLVRQGNERVLRARFKDARFFWDNDLKVRLEDRLPLLDKVTWQAQLGTYREKTDRLVKLTADLKGGAAAQRAALLCKCDLTTDMVKEFTELQGVIGGLYAREQREPEPVWQAIYDHYKPVSMEDGIPATPEGQLVSFADKWDTLVSCFAIGLIPSGSKDPFALRRAAQGVVRILVEGQLGLPLKIENDALREFMRDRVDYYFREVRGFAYDEVRATMAAGWEDPVDLEARLRRIQAVRSTPDFEPLAASFKRIKNILTQARFEGGEAIDPGLLEAGPERELYEEFKARQGQPIEGRIAALRPKVDLFFDKILVNAKEQSVRLNRLTLLHNLLTEFSTIADFSEIVTTEKRVTGA